MQETIFRPPSGGTSPYRARTLILRRRVEPGRDLVAATTLSPNVAKMKAVDLACSRLGDLIANSIRNPSSVRENTATKQPLHPPMFVRSLGRIRPIA